MVLTRNRIRGQLFFHINSDINERLQLNYLLIDGGSTLLGVLLLTFAVTLLEGLLFHFDLAGFDFIVLLPQLEVSHQLRLKDQLARDFVEVNNLRVDVRFLLRQQFVLKEFHQLLEALVQRERSYLRNVRLT